MPEFGFDGRKFTSSATQAAETTVIGAGGAPAFQGTWVDSGDTANDPASYTVINNVVYLFGVVKSGVVGTTVFTMPSGLRPVKNRSMAVASNGALGIVSVLSTGDVQVAVGSVLGVSLSGVSFVVQ